MKKLSFITLLLLLPILSIKTLADRNPVASVKWVQTTIDFGEVPIGEPVSAEFVFSNSGLTPVIITSVKPSCGCTIAEYPKQPISGGQEAKIGVTFDAKTPGYFSKTVTVHANVEGGVKQLYIKGTVKK